VTPEKRGDLAESMAPLAAELAFLVRDEGREAIGAWMDGHGLVPGARVTEATRAFLVVLAAMVRADVTLEELLEWVTWDELGRPLDQTMPLMPVLPLPGRPLEHGTYKAYQRHRVAGHKKDEIEECGCMQAARDYWNAQREAARHAA
jgi:hypothetical protein